jgi:hypothetical protein
MRIGVFAGDLFWSACPYEHLNIAHYLSKECDTDLLMFEKDIRLNKKFEGREKFRFDPSLYQNFPRLRVLKSWDDLASASSDYAAILSNCKIAPKTRMGDIPRSKKSLRCPMVALDAGGTDQLTDCPHADLAIAKSPLWAERVSAMWDIPAIALGCHQYDYYFMDNIEHGRRLTEQQFADKYRVNPRRSLLIAPTNPGSHLDMYRVGIESIEKVCEAFSRHGYALLVKTYPHDYLFHEAESPLTGVYRRSSPHSDGLPQYEYLAKKFGLTVVEGQDHHAAVSWCRFMYNMSGSHVGWETHFTGCRSFSVGYKKQSFFGLVTARGKKFSVPDPFTTIDLDGIDGLPDVPDRPRSDLEYASPFLPVGPLVNKLSLLVHWLEA